LPCAFAGRWCYTISSTRGRSGCPVRRRSVRRSARSRSGRSSKPSAEPSTSPHTLPMRTPIRKKVLLPEPPDRDAFTTALPLVSRPCRLVSRPCRPACRPAPAASSRRSCLSPQLAATASLLHAQQGGGFAPQALQPIIVAYLGREYVDDHAAVVEYHPAGLLLLRRHLVQRFQAPSLGHAIGNPTMDGSDLALVFATTDDEVVGNDGQLANVHQQDIGRALI